ncbi:MAG: aminopeptidase P N-terminal domain-containing protein [Bacteroidales bacterium]|nr:aminopeptidase P N-terminal domain-containing protein [Bacteroidales bacterium]
MKYKELDSDLYLRNRKKLTARMENRSVAIVVSHDEMPDSGDETYPFHQNPNLFYLTGIDQAKSMLLLCPQHPDPAYREVLFLEQTNPTIAVWNGYKYTQEHARRVSGIASIHWIEDFEAILKTALFASDTVYLELDEEARFSTEVETQKQRFCRRMKEQFPLHAYRRLTPLLKDLRVRKEGLEIDQIQTAVDITAKAFDRVLRTLRPGMKEYEVEAELSYEFLKNGASGHAFMPIAASGKNSCVLHYVTNDRICQDGDVLLLDFGCRYANYNSDISRTIPVNGVFSPRQRQVYEACHRIYTETKKHYRPGMTINKLNKIVHGQMEKELIGLGLFTEADVQNNQGDALPLIRKYYMHNIGHFLGLDTHDAGDRDLLFEPGMVVTCEPGIYIAGEGIGVRIETDMLVTESDPIDLGAAIPSEAEEIERRMAEHKQSNQHLH